VNEGAGLGMLVGGLAVWVVKSGPEATAVRVLVEKTTVAGAVSRTGGGGLPAEHPANAPQRATARVNQIILFMNFLPLAFVRTGLN
jgi:hypothetical protein